MENFNSYTQINDALKSKKTSVVQIVAHYLQNIERKKHLNAFLEVWADEALAKAQLIDEKIANGTAGKVAGMVIGIKDNICYKNHKVSASSKILDNFTSLYTATALERLLNEDVIVIGRLNCDEFAMGASNENSAFGTVLNDFDNTKVSGGSSGGSAVSVQANLCHAALGSDTGGSIRQPAAFTGNFGYKPTYGLISRWGLIAYASSFDIIGTVAKSVEDTRLLLSVMAGMDENDATSIQEPSSDFNYELQNKKYKIAYIQETIDMEGVQPEVKEATFKLIEKLKNDGHTVEPISFPELNYVIPIYYTLTTAEASSNLARFAGMHYGLRSKNAVDLETTIRKSRTEGFGPEVKRRIMLGTFVLSAGYYDAYYTKAQKVRRLVANKTQEIFNQFDFILSPTTPTTAFKIGEKSNDPIQMYLADIFTVHANIVGIPAISFPYGADNEKMPIGLQLMANNKEDAKLLAMVDYIRPNNL
ncbi:MAG: Asp-tRNA(Asn)/Glu-tRNA(Gln) amidotransferase subunit GatA [Bacteroidota bacterium]